MKEASFHLGGKVIFVLGYSDSILYLHHTSTRSQAAAKKNVFIQLCVRVCVCVHLRGFVYFHFNRIKSPVNIKIA